MAIFDDLKGKKMVETAKRISGKPIPLERLNEYADEALIKQVHIQLYYGDYNYAF